MGHSQARDFLLGISFLALVWAIAAGLAYSQTDTLYSTASNLCGSLVSVLPIVSLIGAISSGLVYAFGQFSGSEMRARAAVWAATLLAGSLVSAATVAVAPPFLSTLAGTSVSCSSSGWVSSIINPPPNTCSVGGTGTCPSGQTCCSNGACVPSGTSCPAYSQCGVGQQASQACICGTSSTCSPGQYCCSDNTCKSDCYPACSTGSVSSQQCRCNGNQVCSAGLMCCTDGSCSSSCAQACTPNNNNPVSATCKCGPSSTLCSPSSKCCTDGTCSASCISDCAWSDTSPITSQCKCSGMARTSGYCCADGHYDVNGCYDQCASGLNVFDCKCGTSGPVCTSSTGRYCCYGGTCQSGACSVACTDGQQGSCKCGTGAVCTTSQYCYLAGNTCVPSCSEGSITSACKCGSGIYSSGFCCSGTHQSATCAVACSGGAIPSSGCLCGGSLKTSGYCCLNTYSTSQCCANAQLGTCKCGNGPVCSTSQYCFTNVCAPSCTNNAAVVSTGCNCGGTLAVSGYCCNGVLQYSACTQQCTANLQQNCLDSSNTLCSGSKYYYSATKKCVPLCTSDGQQNCLDSAKAYCTGTTYYSTSTAKCTAKCGSWGTSCMCDGYAYCSSTYHCWVGMHQCYRECGQGKITSMCYCGNPPNLYNPPYYCCSGRAQTTACPQSSVLGPCSVSSDCQSGLVCSNKKCCVPAGKTATSQSYCCSGQATVSGYVYLCK
ncbi:MAG: hypothetical protein WC506_06605 [Candidatus Micrarchaeia archaeon]